ncbi:MAG TPA: hypothetical protein ENJ09_15400 [Planctomycetes bacterium]|nr:hypothetical protein [Planctomycetota bacterium]
MECHEPASQPVDRGLPSADASRPGLPRALLLVLLGVLAFHLTWIALEPSPSYFEDEPHYSQFAHEDALLGNTSPLPGHLRFDQRPELGSRLLSRFVPKSELPSLTREHVRGDPHLERTVRWWNLALLLVLLVLQALQARALGLGRRGILLSALLLGLFPWFAFYVHSLWSEILHATLVAASFLAIFAYLRSGRILPLLGGGLALGVALLAKGTMNPFLPVLLGGLLFHGWRSSAERSAATRAALTLLPATLFALAVALVIGPQLVANARAGHGARLAGNRWKNIEMGVLLEPRELQTQAERLERAKLHQLYMGVGADYEAREAAAEERLREHLSTEGFGEVALEQLRKLGLLLFRAPSFFERALHERWGATAPLFLRLLRIPGRVLWFALLGLGLAGAVRFARRNEGFFLLFLFVLYYGAAVLAIPYKVRFLMPLVPPLALLAAAMLDRPRRVSEPTGDQPPRIQSQQP